MFAEDVKCLQRELQAVRSSSKQGRTEMAEQLRWAEEQCTKALRLWHCAQEEGNRKLEKLVGKNTSLNFSGKLGGLT